MMRRIQVITPIFVILVGAFVFGSFHFARTIDPVGAEDSTNQIVGSWVITDHAGIWSTELSLVTFNSDGTVLLTDAFGQAGHGTWIATDDGPIQFGIIMLGTDGTGSSA